MMRALRVRRGLALAIGVIACALPGCHHIRAPRLPDPHDPLPPSEIWAGADEDVASLQERVAKIQNWAEDAELQIEKMDDLLRVRNSELMETRKEHQRAVMDFREMHQTMEQWRGEIAQMQNRLAKQDQQRLLALEELNEQIRALSEMPNP